MDRCEGHHGSQFLFDIFFAMDAAALDSFHSPEDVTQLLADWREGNSGAKERVLLAIQRELHQIARAYLHRERREHTLQPTALINEAYVRLLSGGAVPWRDRVHFLGAAAQVMRHVLVDYGRERQSVKRRGGAVHVSLDETWVAAPERLDEVLAIDQALIKLAGIDIRKSQVVEMRFFGGMDVEETAEALGIAPNTVIRDWSFARAWLRRELSGEQA